MKFEPIKPHGVKIISDPYFSLRADGDGVGFVDCGDGVLVVPLTISNEVLLAVERSPAFDRDILTLVAGAIQPGEHVEQAANRELQEEIGWRAEQLDFLVELHPFKYLLSRQFVILARQLRPSRLAGDEKHPIGVRVLPLEQALSLALSGELQDGCAIAALATAQFYLKQER